ncbi:MAG TPA: CocE/NonD family hydrolase [Acidimicrobiales bacterium]|nr:CocE/NonD family hydrolase [Acidimicrobiales bacterium]
MGDDTEARDAAWWSGDPARTPARMYERSVRTSHYVTVRDGTRIAVDLYLPAGATGPVPTLLTITPYFRSMEFRAPVLKAVFRAAGMAATEWGHEMARFGFATVLMDMRGAGASFGQKKSMMMFDVVNDGYDVIDWIVAQPWSNGRVGSTGISALGMTGQWLATSKHPALKAIAPRFTVFDMYRSLHCNGVHCQRFVADVGRMLRAMDSNRLWDTVENPAAKAMFFALVQGVTPVDDDKGRKLLAAAVAEHADNEGFDEDISGISYRDDLLPVAGGGATLDTQAPATHASDMEAAGIPIYAYGGWYDAAFGREMISLHNTVRTPGSRLVLGPWDHGAKNDCNQPVSGKRPSAFDQAGELARFFDLHLRDVDHGVIAEDPVHYFTMGECVWKSAPAWPPPSEPVRWFLAPGNALSTSPPANAAVDAYRVDFDAGTGVWSRFGKHLSGGFDPASYPERADRDHKLLVYETAPFAEPTEVTGHPVVRLFVTSSEPDASVILYLEDVAPDGTVVNVTEGHMRLSHRKLADPPDFWHTGPFHSGKRQDCSPVTPGETVQLDFDLIPVSWLFCPGHALRVAIAGADKDNFVRIPATGDPVLEFGRGGDAASYVELPVVAR